MSHTLTLPNVKLDQKALQRAAHKLDFVWEDEQTVRFMDGKMVTGTKVMLPGWSKPVVVDAEGNVVYDNYNGHWGSMTELAKLTAVTLVAMTDHDLNSIRVIEEQFGVIRIEAEEVQTATW